MGLFRSTKLFCDVAPYSDTVANSLMSSLRYDGYEVDGIKLPSGDWDISIKKGNLFKAVLGLQTALKIRISPAVPHVYVKASVGIFWSASYPYGIDSMCMVAFCDTTALGNDTTKQIG